jgi:hypothetical protein
MQKTNFSMGARFFYPSDVAVNLLPSACIIQANSSGYCQPIRDENNMQAYSLSGII